MQRLDRREHLSKPETRFRRLLHTEEENTVAFSV